MANFTKIKIVVNDLTSVLIFFLPEDMMMELTQARKVRSGEGP
jgi:hypothetical protein